MINRRSQSPAAAERVGLIHNVTSARRALRWRQFDAHPGTREAVKQYVDKPTPLNLQEANHALDYQLAVPDRAALSAWVRAAPVRRRSTKR